MHLVLDVTEKNYVKNFDEYCNEAYELNDEQMNPSFFPFTAQDENISNFFDSRIKNFERFLLRNLNKTANQPNAPVLELKENPSVDPFYKMINKNSKSNFFDSVNQNAKEAEYSNLSYKAKNEYFLDCKNSLENIQNKFNFNNSNDLAQSQSTIIKPIKFKIDENSYLTNFNDNDNKNYLVNNYDQNRHNLRNLGYNDINTYDFFSEKLKEMSCENNLNSIKNPFCNGDQMLNENFINIKNDENYSSNKIINYNFNDNEKHNYLNLQANSFQEIFNFKIFNNKNKNNFNNPPYSSCTNYNNLNKMMKIFNNNFPNKKTESKSNYLESSDLPLCFTKNIQENNNNYFLYESDKPKIAKLNDGSRSPKEPQKSRGNSENQNCMSTAPFSKLSEDLKLLGKKTKKSSDEGHAVIESKKIRMLKIKNETKIFNSLLSKRKEAAISKPKDASAAAGTDGKESNPLEILENRKSLKNNKLVYVLKNNIMFRNLSSYQEKISNSINYNNTSNWSNENESESKLNELNNNNKSTNLNEEEKGCLNAQSNKEASTVDFVENNSQLEKKDESTEGLKTKSKRSSKYRGVSKNGNQWQVLIMINKKKMYIGSFASEEEAAKNYDYVALKNHGSKAKTNFFYPEEQILSLLKE